MDFGTYIFVLGTHVLRVSVPLLYAYTLHFHTFLPSLYKLHNQTADMTFEAVCRK